MLPSPRTKGLGLRRAFFSRPLVGSLALRPGDSLTIPEMAWSVGFVRFVSSTDATRATGVLPIPPVGLPPTEHASLSWTHYSANTLFAFCRDHEPFVRLADSVSGRDRCGPHRFSPDQSNINDRWSICGAQHPISLPLSARAAPLSDQCIAWQPKLPVPQIQILPRSRPHSVQNSSLWLPSVRRFSPQKQPRAGCAAAWCKCGAPYTDDSHSRSSSLSLPFTPAGP